jgi:hypothetical protein
VLDGEPLDQPAGGVDDSDRVILSRPIDPGDNLIGL